LFPGFVIWVSCAPGLVHPELLPQRREPLRVHGAAVLQELPQTFQPSLSEEGRRLTADRLTPGQFARRLRCSSCGQMPDDVIVMSTDDPHAPVATLRIVIEQESGRARTDRLWPNQTLWGWTQAGQRSISALQLRDQAVHAAQQGHQRFDALAALSTAATSSINAAHLGRAGVCGGLLHLAVCQCVAKAHVHGDRTFFPGSRSASAYRSVA
jgi:hypothetical protein